MAVLQAWPGRGFWQGVSHRQPGTLAGMTAGMAQTPQPGFLASWVNAFTAFEEAHGFAVNLLVVVALAAIGVAFVTGQRRLVRPAVIAFVVLCLADWVLIEDFGFFGGLGTDPNSMLPVRPSRRRVATSRSPPPRRRRRNQSLRRQLAAGLAGAGPAGVRAPVRGHREHPVGRCGRGTRPDHPGRSSDGRGSG